MSSLLVVFCLVGADWARLAGFDVVFDLAFPFGLGHLECRRGGVLALFGLSEILTD